MTFVVRAHGGVSSNGRNPMDSPNERVHGGASSIGLNSMNLRVRVHDGASTSGRNFTRVSWWCLKART